MKALIKEGMIIQVSSEQFEVHKDYIWVECPDECSTSWVYNEGQFSKPYAKDSEIADYKLALKEHLISIANQRQYENDLSLVTYKDSTNLTWKVEADTFISWRDSVWQYCYNELEKFENQRRELVTPEQFINELPAIVWPD